VSAPVLTPKELAVMVRAAVLGGRWGDSPIGEQVDAYLDAPNTRSRPPTPCWPMSTF
jgi:hypothetical protein